MLISLFVAGVLLGLIFWKLEKRNTDPLISPSLVKDPDLRSGLAASFIVTVLFSGVTYLMPLYLLNSHHLDTFTSGMIMTVPALLSFIVSSHAGNFADRYGTRRISMFAVAVAAVGFLVFLTYNPTTILVVIIIGMLVTRVSTSVFCGPNGNLTMNHCPGGAVGNGYGVTMVIRYVGFVFGIVVFQSVFAFRMYAAGIPRLTPELSRLGYQAVRLTSFLLCLVVLYILWRTRKFRRAHNLGDFPCFYSGRELPVPNVYVWMEQGRIDILRCFIAYMEKSGPINCAVLNTKDLGNVISVEMRNPDTGEYVTVCPFLLRVNKERYLCGIHLVKPDMCCTYQPWIWGETYFNRCRGLGKINQSGKWQL